MPIRVGFDVDGVVADFASAYRDIEQRLFDDRVGRPDEPEREEREQQQRRAAVSQPGDLAATPRPDAESPRDLRRRRDLIWREIQSTTDFWTTLAPMEENGVRHIHELMVRHAWEVFFITQRPSTAGATVQRQTQQWLVEQGFDLPTVLVISGSRGGAASALGLTYHVDDNPQNCLDVRNESSAKPLLVAPDGDDAAGASARKLGIGVAPRLSACLQILAKASAARSEPGLLEQLAALVGWR
jgi:hypothetical protein